LKDLIGKNIVMICGNEEKLYTGKVIGTQIKLANSSSYLVSLDANAYSEILFSRNKAPIVILYVKLDHQANSCSSVNSDSEKLGGECSVNRVGG